MIQKMKARISLKTYRARVIKYLDPLFINCSYPGGWIWNFLKSFCFGYFKYCDVCQDSFCFDEVILDGSREPKIAKWIKLAKSTVCSALKHFGERVSDWISSKRTSSNRSWSRVKKVTVMKRWFNKMVAQVVFIKQDKDYQNQNQNKIGIAFLCYFPFKMQEMILITKFLSWFR